MNVMQFACFYGNDIKEYPEKEIEGYDYTDPDVCNKRNFKAGKLKFVKGVKFLWYLYKNSDLVGITIRDKEWTIFLTREQFIELFKQKI